MSLASISCPAGPLASVQPTACRGAASPSEVWELGDPTAYPEWDEWVLSKSDFNFFHTNAWAAVLKESYGYPIHYLGLGGAAPKLRGALPLMEIRSWLTGKRGVTLPFTDECAPLADSSESCDLLISHALQLARARNWKYFEWRGACPCDPPRTVGLSYFGHRIPLSNNEQEMFRRLDSATQRGVNKARKNGLAIEISTRPDALAKFYDLHGRTRQKHGQPVQPFSFFEAIDHHILSQGKGCIILAAKDNRPLAASIFFHAGKRALYKFGASDERHLSLRGNNLVMWEAMRHYGNAGYDSLDLGRTSRDNEGLRRFKAGWGSEERTIPYYRFDLRRNAFVTIQDQAHGFQNAFLRKMPIPALILLGRMLYKHAA